MKELGFGGGVRKRSSITTRLVKINASYYVIEFLRRRATAAQITLVVIPLQSARRNCPEQEILSKGLLDMFGGR